jgi:ATP-binding cassette subfamily B multidrug efflux pump
MVRYFENFVDSFCDYAQTNTPPIKLLPFLRQYCQPRGAMALTFVGLLFLGGIELGMIYAVGRFVNVLQNTPQFVSQNLTVALIGLVLFFLLIRPILFGFDTMLIQRSIFPILQHWCTAEHIGMSSGNLLGSLKIIFLVALLTM